MLDIPLKPIKVVIRRSTQLITQITLSSNLGFRSKITEKPNSIKTIPESIIKINLRVRITVGIATISMLFIKGSIMLETPSRIAEQPKGIDEAGIGSIFSFLKRKIEKAQIIVSTAVKTVIVAPIPS